MARTTTITDEQILDAARQLFMRDGLRATTAEIAKLAGVSEGSVFRRFASKNQLFLAAMFTEEPELFGQLKLAGTGDIQENLVEVATRLLEFLLDMVPRLMLVASKGLGASNTIDDLLPVKGLRLLTKYFEAEMSSGRLAVSDPQILARLFVGALHHYAFAEALGINAVLPIPADVYVRDVVELILRGSEARDVS